MQSNPNNTEFTATFWHKKINYAFKYKAAYHAQIAMLKEICLNPKPGLVDPYDQGAHKDMNFLTFINSITAISPFLDLFYDFGRSYTGEFPNLFLQPLKKIGMECETAMFHATKGVNTHKGAIFSLSLILSTIGKRKAQKEKITVSSICSDVALICKGLIEQELENAANTSKQKTAGEKLYLQFNLTGARGEAESGYELVRTIALPIYHHYSSLNYSENAILIEVMLHLFMHNNDTNIVSRAGLEGLCFLKKSAKNLIVDHHCDIETRTSQLHELNTQLIDKNMSPGGTADLLIITLFLSHYDL